MFVRRSKCGRFENVHWGTDGLSSGFWHVGGPDACRNEIDSQPLTCAVCQCLLLGPHMRVQISTWLLCIPAACLLGCISLLQLCSLFFTLKLQHGGRWPLYLLSAQHTQASRLRKWSLGCLNKCSKGVISVNWMAVNEPFYYSLPFIYYRYFHVGGFSSGRTLLRSSQTTEILNSLPPTVPNYGRDQTL